MDQPPIAEQPVNPPPVTLNLLLTKISAQAPYKEIEKGMIADGKHESHVKSTLNVIFTCMAIAACKGELHSPIFDASYHGSNYLFYNNPLCKSITKLLSEQEGVTIVYQTVKQLVEAGVQIPKEEFARYYPVICWGGYLPPEGTYFTNTKDIKKKGCLDRKTKEDRRLSRREQRMAQSLFTLQ